MSTASDSSAPHSSRNVKVLKGVLLALLLFYVGFATFFYFTQDKLVFPAPATYPHTTPADVGIPFEDLHIPVNRSEQIHAWWIPAVSPTDRVILALHGNGYVIEQELGTDRAGSEATALRQLGANLLLVEYRGYGSSSPTPSEKHVYEDAEAAFTYLTAQRKVPASDIVIFGRSMGTAAATELARQHSDAEGLMLMSPFTSLTEAAKAIWYLRALPLSLLAKTRFDNLSRINDVHVPILIMVGSEDNLTPPSMSQALFQKANQPKRLYLQPGAGHNDIIKIGGQRLENQMSAFIQLLK